MIRADRPRHPPNTESTKSLTNLKKSDIIDFLVSDDWRDAHVLQNLVILQKQLQHTNHSSPTFPVKIFFAAFPEGAIRSIPRELGDFEAIPRCEMSVLPELALVSYPEPGPELGSRFG